MQSSGSIEVAAVRGDDPEPVERICDSDLVLQRLRDAQRGFEHLSSSWVVAQIDSEIAQPMVGLGKGRQVATIGINCSIQPTPYLIVSSAAGPVRPHGRAKSQQFRLALVVMEPCQCFAQIVPVSVEQTKP